MKNKNRLNVLTLIFFFTISLCFVTYFEGKYGGVSKNIDKVTHTETFGENLEETILPYYAKTYHKSLKKDEPVNYFDILFEDKITTKENKEEEISEPDYKMIESIFNQNVDNQVMKDYEYINLEYYVSIPSLNVSSTNSRLKMENLLSENTYARQSIENEYQWYMIFYIKNNKITRIETSDNYFVNRMSNYDMMKNVEESLLHNSEYDLKFNKLEDAVFIYGIDTEMSFYDNITRELDFYDSLDYTSKRNDIVQVFAIVCFVLFILGICFSSDKMIQKTALYAYLDSPVEIWIISSLAFLSIKYNFTLVTNPNSGHFLLILLDTLLFSLVFHYTILINYYFTNGFTLKFKQNCYLDFYKKAYAFAKKYFSELDFATSKINKILLIVTVLLIIFSSLGYTNNLFAQLFFILFWGILYLMLNHKITAIQSQYEELLDSTKHLAERNFTMDQDKQYPFFQQFANSLIVIEKEFKKAVDDELKSQSLKNELITNISHDLKTPLTSIITYIDLMKDDTLNKETRDKYLLTLEHNSLRLKHLIDDLFEISKANSGNITLNYMNIDLVALIKQIHFELEDKINSSKLTFKYTYSSDKIMICLDPQKTYRILENLYSNVLKYALDNTRVFIEVKEDIDKVTFMMKNVSSRELNFDKKEIMERFARGDVSRNSEGSGLGLSIIDTFTEIQDGTFDIETDGDIFKAIVVFPKIEREIEIEKD